jgi:hypothetical protein
VFRKYFVLNFREEITNPNVLFLVVIFGFSLHYPGIYKIGKKSFVGFIFALIQGNVAMVLSI